MDGEFQIGTWLVQPGLNLISRDGTPVHLEPKVMEVLVCLAQHTGELVSKEELLRTIWRDTFVTEDALKRCVFELRRVFEDDAHDPRIIETIPKRGYRLIAPVIRDGLATIGAPGATESAVISFHKRKLVLAAAAGVLFILAAGGLIWRWRQPRHLTEKDSIVLGDFVNLTGDAVFDATLRQGLAVQLEQSPFLKLLSEEEIRQTLRMMGQKTSVRLTPETGREVCHRTNSAAVLDGSIALIGTRYDVILRAVDCASGDFLASAEAQANDKSHVLDALSSAASQMRRKLGESLGTVQKFNTPLSQATTSSLEALQSYTLGQENVRQTGNFAASLPYFQKAIELDPNFAMAYWAMSDAYNTFGETASSAAYIRKAFALRGGVSELEKLLIEGDYYFYGNGDIVKARPSFELTAEIYPRDDYVHNVLADFSSILGQHEAALRHYLEALRLAPQNSILYRHVAYTYVLLNRVEDAAATAGEAHAKGLDSDLGPILYGIAFYQKDSAEMARRVTGSAGKPGEEDLLLALEADTVAYFGHLGTARELSRRAADSAERAGEKETAATYYAVSALREALFGDAYKARQQAATARRHSTGRDLDYGAVLALAYAGDTHRAQTLADDLGKKFPEDTVVQFNYVPTLRAKLALLRSKPQQALDALGIAAPYELGLPSYSFYNWPNLYPVYVRGEAYLAAHQGGEAAAEFQKIIDHRGIVLNEPIGALAHLQLGRAYALQGDTAKARAAYQDFFTLWKDADPDIPILKQAKAEYAKLQ
jgi:DNA-binding winged helix-turn-helix (wHTH) protein/Tfp pilus assembly protein PilF